MINRGGRAGDHYHESDYKLRPCSVIVTRIYIRGEGGALTGEYYRRKPTGLKAKRRADGGGNSGMLQ